MFFSKVRSRAGWRSCHPLNCTLITGFRDDDPENQVCSNARDTTGNQSDQEGQAEPESADAVEFSQSAADTGNYAVAA